MEKLGYLLPRVAAAASRLALKFAGQGSLLSTVLKQLVGHLPKQIEAVPVSDTFPPEGDVAETVRESETKESL